MKNMNQRIVVSGVFIIALASGIAVALNSTTTSNINGLDALQKQEGAFELTLILPDADFSKYQSIYAMPVVVKFRPHMERADSAPTGTLRRQKDKRSPGPTEDEVTMYNEVISKGLLSTLEQGSSFKLVSEALPNTLVLRASIVDIVSNIPAKTKARFRGDVVAEGIFVFDLIDAETGLIQARIGERRTAKHDTSQKKPKTELLWKEVEDWAAGAAADLLTELEKTQKNQDVGI